MFCTLCRLDACPGAVLPAHGIRSESGSRTISPNWSASRDEFELATAAKCKVTPSSTSKRSLKSNYITRFAISRKGLVLAFLEFLRPLESGREVKFPNRGNRRPIKGLADSIESNAASGIPAALVERRR